MSVERPIDRAILATFAIPSLYVGKPPGDPDDCTCRECLIALGNEPTTVQLVENGVLPLATLKFPHQGLPD